MLTNYDDALWTAFKPLWNDLRTAGDTLLVAGGYGLFLKQLWLMEHPEVPSIVSLGQWVDPRPRVTKDLDVVVGCDLIAQAEHNRALAAILHKNGFVASPINPRWQFKKSLAPDRDIIVELHAPSPPKHAPDLIADRMRIKHKPSLGDAGVHCRTNPEAIGCEHHPFHFTLEGLPLSVPNPVTWSVMKLAAMADRWARADEEDRRPEERDYLSAQAIKHARDICRVVAMVTIDERDQAEAVSGAIDGHPVFIRSKKNHAEFFQHARSRGTLAVRDMWREDDLGRIQEILAHWFG